MRTVAPPRYSGWILLGLALVFAASAFVLPLPGGFGGSEGPSWPRAVMVLLVLLFFAIAVALQRTLRTRNPRIWLTVASVAFALAAVSLIAHRLVASTRTCRYYDQFRIIGTEMTALAADYVNRYPGSGCEDLLKAFTGRADEAWTEASLRRSELTVGGTFVWIVPLAAMGVMAIAQVLQPASAAAGSVPEGASVFISYASEDRRYAEDIQLALVGLGYRVFFDKESLPSGGDFHGRIRSEIEQSDAMVFLISPDSVAPGSYALTELKFAREKWVHPKGRVLPVMVRRTQFAGIPQYLRAVTVLEPEGNIAAETARAVEKLA